MKGEQFSFFAIDQKSSKYFCKHPKIKFYCQRYLPCKSETLQACNICRRVQLCPQREHALSISEFPHRRKLFGVGDCLKGETKFAVTHSKYQSAPSQIRMHHICPFQKLSLKFLFPKFRQPFLSVNLRD